MEQVCKYCRRNQLFIRQSGNNTGLYCRICGKWKKWLNKNEIRAFEAQKEKSLHENEDNSNSDIIERLQEFADRLDDEISKELTRKSLGEADAISKCAVATAYEKDRNAILAIIAGKRYYEV